MIGQRNKLLLGRERNAGLIFCVMAMICSDSVAITEIEMVRGAARLYAVHVLAN